MRKMIDVNITITCGEEVLTLAQPNNAVFDIYAGVASSTALTYALAGIWTVTHPNSYINANNSCSISSYKVVNVVGNLSTNPTFDVTGDLALGYNLTVDIHLPIVMTNKYLTPVTVSGKELQ